MAGNAGAALPLLLGLAGAAGLTIDAGPVAVTLTGAGIAQIAARTPSGTERHFEVDGSGTQLEGCTLVTGVLEPTGSQSAVLTRQFVCQPGAYHNLTGAAATVADQFSVDGRTIRWATKVWSSSRLPWGVPITAALRFMRWNQTARVWLGGPRSGAPPSLAADPFAPYLLPNPSGDGLATGPSGGWYVAEGYDATYGCLSGPCQPKGRTSSAAGCQQLCEVSASCSIYAWAQRTHDCWFRTDGRWAASGTLHSYAATSGCRLGTDPASGNPYVAACGPIPGGSAKLFYGGTDNDIGGPKQNNDGPAAVLPVLSVIEPELGISLVHSPRDTPIVAFAAAARDGQAGFVNWTRLYHRLGSDALLVEFTANILAHAPDWRPAGKFLRDSYPEFFEPKASPATMDRIAGTGSYADMRGPADMDVAAAAKYKTFGWGLNWDSSARFPWHGEWIPTKKDGFDDQWLTCFAHVPPDGHTNEGCMGVSYQEIAGWYEHIRRMGSAVGSVFSSCQYGNLFEFGWNVKQSWRKTINCSAAAVAASNRTKLLCHSQQLIREKYAPALLFSPEDPSPNHGELVCGGMEGSCIMDPHPELPYLDHLLDMANTSMRTVPSSGVCIDRQDWLGSVNPNADDHRTWLPVAGGFMAVRAMIHSWKLAMAAFSQVWHSGGQAVVINDHSNRLDMMEFADGIYAEMGDMATSDPKALGSLNAHGIGTALATLGPKVAYIWNHPGKNMSNAYVAAGLQTHLWAGVFPTVPIKNNDHAIGGDCAPDCPYDSVFADYGHLFDAIRGRSWVLAAQPAEVTSNNALANLFAVPAGYAAPIIQARADSTVQVTLRGLDCTPNSAKVDYLQPGNITAVLGRVLTISTGGECGPAGGWGRNSTDHCMRLQLDFSKGSATNNVVLVVINCDKSTT